METKLKFLVSGVVICLLMAICPSVTAEELANNAKDMPNMTVYESDEIEWQVVWQDEIGTAEVVYGEPKVIWKVIGIAFWVWTAYDAYMSAKDGDYVAAIVSITPAGKISKVEKTLKAHTKLEKHHLLPVQFEWYFRRAGININDCIMMLPVDVHRLNPNGIHTVMGGNWNERWKEFIIKNPRPKPDKKDREKIFNYMWELIDDFKLKGYMIRGRCK